MANDSTSLTGYGEHYDEELRLCILRALNDDPGKSCNDSLLFRICGDYGFKCPRDRIRNQMRWLEVTAGAIRLREPGSALVAELTETGLDHLERRQVLEGVKQPSLPR